MNDETIRQLSEMGTQKLTRLYSANEWLEPTKLRRTAENICTENASYRTRRAKLVALADRVNDALKPEAFCRSGCGHCCSMTTMIYRHEAVLIANFTGESMHELSVRPYDLAYKLASRHFGDTCPFLVDQRCSVYEVRPLVCRLHHALNENIAACDSAVPLHDRVPLVRYDVDALEIPYHLLVRSHVREPWGAIQEFFPR